MWINLANSDYVQVRSFRVLQKYTHTHALARTHAHNRTHSVGPKISNTQWQEKLRKELHSQHTTVVTAEFICTIQYPRCSVHRHTHAHTYTHTNCLCCVCIFLCTFFFLSVRYYFRNIVDTQVNLSELFSLSPRHNMLYMYHSNTNIPPILYNGRLPLCTRTHINTRRAHKPNRLFKGLFGWNFNKTLSEVRKT